MRGRAFIAGDDLEFRADQRVEGAREHSRVLVRRGGAKHDLRLRRILDAARPSFPRSRPPPTETARAGLPIQLNFTGLNCVPLSFKSGARTKPRVMKPQASRPAGRRA